ncbi:MAG: endonuclease [Myxococcota bacterium]
MRRSAILFSVLTASCTDPSSRPSASQADKKGPPSREVEKGPKNYDDARGLLAGLFKGPGKTWYCACRYDGRRKVDARACGLPTDLGAPERRGRVEWEHVVPAATFGKRLPAWDGAHPECERARKRGRECLRMVSPAFNRMEADLYNLRPVVGSVNELRGSRAMSEIRGDDGVGRCDLEVHRGQVEPPDPVKGDVARIYLHMEARYPGRGIVDRRDRDAYLRWSREDPASSEECALIRRIEALMGYSSPVYGEACPVRASD